MCWKFIKKSPQDQHYGGKWRLGQRKELNCDVSAKKAENVSLSYRKPWSEDGVVLTWSKDTRTLYAPSPAPPPPSLPRRPIEEGLSLDKMAIFSLTIHKRDSDAGLQWLIPPTVGKWVSQFWRWEVGGTHQYPSQNPKENSWLDKGFGQEAQRVHWSALTLSLLPSGSYEITSIACMGSFPSSF